jgi:tetratricopeptide (TPR) repeat protein
VSNLLIGLVSALVATNPPTAISNLVVKETGVSVGIVNSNDPVEKELQKLMDQDDEAQAEVDKWIRENQEFVVKGAGVSAAALNQRIRTRFEPVRKAYDDFVTRHPNHVRARIAYASFLGDIRDEDGAFDQLEKARELGPTDPAVWNNLANYYGHNGPVTKAFDYYAKAIELNPNETIYYHNFGTTVFLFRKDAVEHFNIPEQQVFDKALELYSHALRLDPANFPLASDVAQTYYGIQPPRTDDALRSWTNALSLAHDEIEREGVYVHFVRVKTHSGRFTEAHAHLNTITNEMYADLKKRLARALNEKESEAKGTNAPAATVEKKLGQGEGPSAPRLLVPAGATSLRKWQ